jgi:hypothetical protein
MTTIYSNNTREVLDVDLISIHTYNKTSSFLYNNEPVEIMIIIKNVCIKYNNHKKLAVIVNDAQLNKLDNRLVSLAGTKPFIRKEVLIIGKKEFNKMYNFDPSKKNITVSLSCIKHTNGKNLPKFELCFQTE